MINYLILHDIKKLNIIKYHYILIKIYFYNRLECVYNITTSFLLNWLIYSLLIKLDLSQLNINESYYNLLSILFYLFLVDYYTITFDKIEELLDFKIL